MTDDEVINVLRQQATEPNMLDALQGTSSKPASLSNEGGLDGGQSAKCKAVMAGRTEALSLEHHRVALTGILILVTEDIDCLDKSHSS